LSSIIFSGDLFISEENFSNELISSEIIELFNTCDYRIINLESAVVDNIEKYKIKKTGPHINGSKKTFNLLKQLNVNTVTLANNHIMDYGIEGLKRTISGCKDNEIDFIGAGLSLEEAILPKIFLIGDTRVGLLNFAENEWASAERNRAGANPLDIISNVNQIKALKAKVDLVIVIIHGGHEYYHLPSPRMVKQYRFYAENGADLIVGHHPHCIGGYEIYNNVPVFYSLGNFLFTRKSKNPDWYEGLLLHVELHDKSINNWKLYPVKQNNDNYLVDLMSDHNSERVLRQVEKYKTIIEDEETLQKSFDHYVSESEISIISTFFPYIPIRRITKLFYRNQIPGFIKKKLYSILNNIRCESHLEVKIKAIKKILDSIN
jgi:poly-gamma-glutamate capsule biosynthesis protein CapA/YwtB (metallophosphatase superfamily)